MPGKLSTCFVFQPVTQGNVLGYQVYYNEEMINVETSTTTLTFTALSLPDGVFTSIIVFTVSAINRYGIGQGSEETAVIHGKINNAKFKICCYMILKNLQIEKRESESTFVL